MIKFRGITYEGKWVYGLPYSSGYDGEIDQIVEGDTHHDVYPETVTQYTGKQDKTGKEVYVGDLLDFDEVEWGGKFEPEEVTWSEVVGCWDLCGSLSDLSVWRKVVGSVHDKLLK